MTRARWVALVALGLLLRPAGLARASIPAPAVAAIDNHGSDHPVDPRASRARLADERTGAPSVDDVPNGLVRFRAFGPAEGLRNLVIWSIGQEASGFLWVGTDDGLYRFDGERFTHFGDAAGLHTSKIHAVTAAPGGHMCAASNTGLACWDGTRFSQEVELPQGPVYAIATSGDQLWIGADSGLYVRDGHGLARAPGWTSTQPVRALWIDEHGAVVADGDRLVARDRGGAWHPLDVGLGGERLVDILRDRSGTLWIRGARHLWQLPAGAPQVIDVSDGFPPTFNVGPTNTMVNGPHGEVWFASDLGIAYRDAGRWRLIGRGEGLPFPGVRTLFVDREGSTWQGSDGLYQWRGRGLIERYEVSNGLPGDTGWSFQRDRRGVLWAGTNQCLAAARGGRWACWPGSEHRTVRSFVFPPQGGVFLGGSPPELMYLDPTGHAQVLAREDTNAADREILAMTLGPEGDLWLGTRGGLFRLRGAVPGPIERVAIPGVRGDAWFPSLLVDNAALWAASSDGLAVYEAGAWRVYGVEDGLRARSMRYLAQTSRGLCVTYTDSIGLSCFQREPGGALRQPRHIGVEEGLATGMIYFLGEDRGHNLWVGTGTGVDVLSASGIEHFSQTDGLAGDDAAATAFFLDRDGSLWLGATGGVSHVRADRYAGPPPPPRALVRAGQLGTLALRGGDVGGLETSHENNALRVELGSDRLADAERVEYQVRLAPLEPAWSATLARQARYPALLPGDYRFEVRARVGTGAWGPTTSLAFVVDPAWWQTRWFLALACAATMLSLALALSWRQRAVLQRRTRQLNEQSTAHVRALIDRVPDLISVHQRGMLIYANQAARRAYGLDDSEGPYEVSGLGPRVHADDAPRVAELLSAPDDDAQWDSPIVELRVRDRRGGWRAIEISAVRMELAGARVLVASGHDITERQQLHTQLLVSDRMAGLGTLAAGIAHEINNPLAYVIGNLQLMRDALAAGEPHRPDFDVALNDATDGAQRVRKIVQGLRSFSRAEEEARVQLEISEVLRAAIRLTANEVRHRAQLVCELGATPKVVADDSRLTQVFINLIVNAAHAIAEGRYDDNRITLRTKTDELGRVVVEVEDTGRGMSPEVLFRAFDPFYTTKDVGSGTGLGLAICHGIVSGLGGEIAIDSVVGRGTTVRVMLPSAPGVAEVSVPRAMTPEVRAAPDKLKVLIVDDEPLVADMLARVLRRDHDVVAVSCGSDALAQITGGTWFDAIVSDVMMPNMTGIELLDALVQLDPEQAKRLIFLSGGVFTPQTRARLDALGTMQLEKPIGNKELRRAVMSVARGELLAPEAAAAG